MSEWSIFLNGRGRRKFTWRKSEMGGVCVAPYEQEQIAGIFVTYLRFLFALQGLSLAFFHLGFYLMRM